MTTLDKEITKKIAKLAKLRVSAQEIEQYTNDLAKILTHIAELNKLDTTNIEPLVHGIELTEHYREDEAKFLNEDEIQNILTCSEAILYEQYKVPQVIGGES